jgi:hypothetical protein
MNENHKNHKLLWNELARTGEDGKGEIIERLGLPCSCHDCYACDSSDKSGRSCPEGCPILWSNGKYTACDAWDSPFKKWSEAKTSRTRKKYALIIANMKWRTKK